MIRDGKLIQKVLLFFAVFLNYCLIHQGSGGGTATSRMDLLYSLYVYNTIQIDAYHSNTDDKAQYAGHYYSNKAPATALVAIPGFCLAMQISYWCDMDHTRSSTEYFISWITSALSVGLIGAIGGVFFALWLRRWFGWDSAAFMALVMQIGSGLFAYSTMLLSHSLCVSLISAFLYLIHYPSNEAFVASKPSLLRYLLAGGALAGALASEYSSGIVVLGLLLLLKDVPMAKITWFFVGFSLIAAIVPFWNYISYGNCFVIGYALPARFVELNRGFYGIEWPPKLDGVWVLLFSSSRGLFYYTPLFYLFIFGAYHVFRLSRFIFYLFHAIVIVHFLLMASYWEPEGGLALGPRYLSPMLPLLGYICCSAVPYFPRLSCGLGLLSVFVTFTVTFSGAQLFGAIANVLFGAALPKISVGLSSSIFQQWMIPVGHIYVFTLACNLVYVLVLSRQVWSRDREKSLASLDVDIATRTV